MNYRTIRKESQRRLRNAKVPEHPNLPLLDEYPQRSAQDVARRIVALYCLTGLANGASGSAMLDWIQTESLEGYFEPEELGALAGPTPTEEQLSALSWCQESLYAGVWSMALIHDLAWPDAECSLDPVFPRIPPEVDAGSFILDASLRSAEQLVHAADLYYCLDAALRHGELWGGAPVESRYPMVQIVMERRRIFEWIMQTGRWSDVVLDT